MTENSIQKVTHSLFLWERRRWAGGGDKKAGMGYLQLTLLSVGLLAPCGSWGSLESFLCLASESEFFQPCLVFLGSLKGQLRENMNWFFQRELPLLSLHLAVQGKCLKHGGLREISCFCFLPSPVVNFLPWMKEPDLVLILFPTVLDTQPKKTSKPTHIPRSPQLFLELMKTSWCHGLFLYSDV